MDPTSYPAGEADVVAAVQNASVSFPDMVNIVLRTSEPITSFDPVVCNHLFDLIDADSNGVLTEVSSPARV